MQTEGELKNMAFYMNEEYELKKIVKISAIVGGVWGFVNGLCTRNIFNSECWNK